MTGKRAMCVIAFLLVLAPISALAKITNPFLYELKYKNKISYLLGTIHSGVSIDELPQEVINLHSEVEVHFYEIMRTRESMAFYRLLTTNIDQANKMRFHGKPFNEFNFQEVEHLKEIGFPEAYIPYLSANDCMLVFGRKYIFGAGFASIDQTLMENSEKAGKEVIELDSDFLREAAPPACTRSFPQNNFPTS